jgi:DNA-binding CsgD family transcriptional regulator
MCQHDPRCPDWPARDHRARIMEDLPGQGWSLLCNSVIVLDGGGELGSAGSASHRSRGDVGAPSPRQAEPLSQSEIRVLRYLPTNLSAREIARELSVSVNTVRTHMRHMFAKLGAHRRTEAVARARSLGLLGPSPHSPMKVSGICRDCGSNGVLALLTGPLRGLAGVAP